MSFPNLPTNISPNITITKDNAIDLLLASIAFEELGLAHLINAEAEKIQSVLGTLHNQAVHNPSIDDLERIDKVVERVLQAAIKQEMLLHFKLQNVIDEIPTGEPVCDCSLLTTFAGEFDFVFGAVNNPSSPFNGNPALLFADVCGDCQNPTNSSVAYFVTDPIDFAEILYAFIADPATITVTCPAPGTIIVKGSGTASNSNALTSPATFTLTAVDNAPDSFQIIIDAENNALDHDSGTVALTAPDAGDIVVCECPCAAAGLRAKVDLSNISALKTKVQERIEKSKQ